MSAGCDSRSRGKNAERQEQHDEDEREDALHRRGAAGAQRERHADRARSPCRSRCRSAAPRARPATPADDVGAEDQPEREEVGDLDGGERRPRRGAGRARIDTRGMGEATRRSKNPPSISSAVAMPAPTPPSSSDCVHRRRPAGSRGTRGPPGSPAGPCCGAGRPMLMARNSEGKMSSGARNWGRRSVLRSARRASATRRAHQATASPATRLRLGRRRRGLVVALEVAAGLLDEHVVERRLRRARATRRGGRPRRARGPRRRSRVAPPAIAIERWQPSPGGRSVAEARQHLARAVDVACPRRRRQVEVRAADLGLQRGGRALGDDPPALMIPTRSASWSASSRYWVVRKTVVPSSCRRRTSSQSVIARDGVQPGRGLVEEQHLGLVDQRHGEVEAAAHAARVGAHAAVRRLAEPDARRSARRRGRRPRAAGSRAASPGAPSARGRS